MADRSKQSRIKGLSFDDNALVRTSVVGDCLHMTWARDDRLLAGLCDGYGVQTEPSNTYNSRLIEIADLPNAPVFSEVASYPLLEPSTDATRYYGFGALARNGRIVQFLSSLNNPFTGGSGDTAAGTEFVGVKAIYSDDDGATWRNQDGSTPVKWEDWSERSRSNMIFFEEDQHAFSLLSILQMGRDYEANEDGYVYVYAPNGNTEGAMNELVMFRVKADDLLRRNAYEFFAGLDKSSDPIWSSDIHAREVVHRFASGFVNRRRFPHAWQPSLCYNPGLGVYMMTNYGIGTTEDGIWFGRPSYFGFWVADNPWGPWRQIHEQTQWAPLGQSQARGYQAQIVPKWMADDGRSFWLVWGDFQGASDIPAADAEQLLKLRTEGRSVEATRFGAKLIRRYMPFYSVNAQRVELTLE